MNIFMQRLAWTVSAVCLLAINSTLAQAQIAGLPGHLHQELGRR